MSERLIAADEARCRGDGSTHCADCARRMQLERDDEKRWYPHMEAAPIRGSCVYKILVRSNTPNALVVGRAASHTNEQLELTSWSEQ